MLFARGKLLHALLRPNLVTYICTSYEAVAVFGNYCHCCFVYTIIFYSCSCIHTSRNLMVRELVISTTRRYPLLHNNSAASYSTPSAGLLLISNFMYCTRIFLQFLILQFSYTTVLLHAVFSLLAIYRSKTSPLHRCRYTRNFSFVGEGGTYPEAIYNICLILRTML